MSLQCRLCNALCMLCRLPHKALLIRVGLVYSYACYACYASHMLAICLLCRVDRKLMVSTIHASHLYHPDDDPKRHTRRAMFRVLNIEQNIVLCGIRIYAYMVLTVDDQKGYASVCLICHQWHQVHLNCYNHGFVVRLPTALFTVSFPIGFKSGSRSKN